MERERRISELLQAITQGDRRAVSLLWERVYEKVRRTAARFVADESRGKTMDASDLVNEVYLRLFEKETPCWENSRHFYGTVARAMRRILVEQARIRRIRGRHKDLEQIVDEKTEESDLVDLARIDIEALDLALRKLERDPKRARVAKIVELRFFGGLSIEETAEVLGVSESTITRKWQLVRAWLYRELKKRRRR